jgi:hypothetical protein
MIYRDFDQQGRWLLIEALTFGLAYGAGLCWVSVCLLASFRPNRLSTPYWSAIPAIRTDTCGILAFFAVTVFLTWSEFLRFRRRRAGTITANIVSHGPLIDLVALATSETVAVLGTGLAIYLSVNAVTHPVTLGMPATHLMSWPTEGTLRVIALLLCVVSASTLRFLWHRARIRCKPYHST